MKPAHGFGEALVGPAPHPGLNERAVNAEIDLRYTGDRRKPSLVLLVVAAQCPDIVKGPGFEAHQIVTTDQVGGRLLEVLWCHNRLVEPRRQHIDEIDI